MRDIPPRADGYFQNMPANRRADGLAQLLDARQPLGQVQAAVKGDGAGMPGGRGDCGVLEDGGEAGGSWLEGGEGGGAGAGGADWFLGLQSLFFFTVLFEAGGDDDRDVEAYAKRHETRTDERPFALLQEDVEGLGFRLGALTPLRGKTTSSS